MQTHTSQAFRGNPGIHILYEAPIRLNAISQASDDQSLLPFVAGDAFDMDRNGVANTSYATESWYRQGTLEGHRGVSTYGTCTEPVLSNGFDSLAEVARKLGRDVLVEGDCEVPLQYPKAYYGGHVTAPTLPRSVMSGQAATLSQFKDKLLEGLPGVQVRWAIDTATRSFLLFQGAPD